MYYPNGFLIQHTNQPNVSMGFIRHFAYHGISACNTYPLSEFPEYRHLTDKMMTQEFITDPDLLKRCVNACRECNIPIRILFVESGYSGEIWQGSAVQKKLLGYEYNTVPIDDQIVTDLEWYEPLSKFRKYLNADGLFPSEKTVCRFKTEYDRAFQSKQIGDGEMDAYIFRISEVNTEDTV